MKSIIGLEDELQSLIRIRGGVVGIDLKRVNYKIAELQHKIDRRRRG